MFFLAQENQNQLPRNSVAADDWFGLHRKQFPDEIENDANCERNSIATRIANAVECDDAALCAKCGSVFAWLDTFGTRRCLECSEPPTFAMVKFIRVFVRERFEFDATDLLSKKLSDERRNRNRVAWRAAAIAKADASGVPDNF